MGVALIGDCSQCGRSSNLNITTNKCEKCDPPQTPLLVVPEAQAYGGDQFAQGMASRSGNVISYDPLVAFIYILMRDHIHPGDMENIFRNNVEPVLRNPNEETHFSNGWLARYAEDYVTRLRSNDKHLRKNENA